MWKTRRNTKGGRSASGQPLIKYNFAISIDASILIASFKNLGCSTTTANKRVYKRVHKMAIEYSICGEQKASLQLMCRSIIRCPLILPTSGSSVVGRPTQLIYISDIYLLRWSTQKYKYEEQRSSCWAINKVIRGRYAGIRTPSCFFHSIIKIRDYALTQANTQTYHLQ